MPASLAIVAAQLGDALRRALVAGGDRRDDEVGGDQRVDVSGPRFEGVSITTWS